jgi:hypothetical protein
MGIFDPHEGVTQAEEDAWMWATAEQDDYGPMATEADAHAEWHRNTGIPMGQPGCPQDACHPVDDYDDECEGHESLDGAHMGETVYCDGSCRQAVTARPQQGH